MKFVSPIIEILYPIVIVYSVGNLLWKWWKFQTQRPVLLTITPETSDWEE
jgi:branched-subunit amino acid permease